jgi:N-carbamoyl-L-amino-acid hydrolase
MQKITVNQQRLWDSLMQMGEIGGTEKGGVCRLALTDLDKQGRDLFVRWCKDAGCSIRIDKMGNIFARRAGTDDSLPPVVMGSHLDTQPTGGKFDGIYGVLSGLEVIRSLNDQGIETRAPIEASVWTNEEGSRFPPAMVASGVFAGVFDLEYGLSRADLDGKTMGQELERIGYAAPGERPGQIHIEAVGSDPVDDAGVYEDDCGHDGRRMGIRFGRAGEHADEDVGTTESHRLLDQVRAHAHHVAM